MKCPKCGEEIVGVPAISRYDEKTELCKYCGTREALEIVGATKKHIEEIVSAIKAKEKEISIK